MDWKNILKLDRAKLRQRRKEGMESIDELTQLPEEDRAYMRSALGRDLNAEKESHRDARREKRRKMGLLESYRKPFGTPRKNRPHRMKEEDKPKPRRRATEKEQMETRRRNKPPIMGDRGRQGFRGH